MNARVRSKVERWVRWNFLPFYAGMASANLFVLSTPKCGRTWLRTFLTAYDAHSRGLAPGNELEVTERRLGIFFAHDRWEHAVAPWSTLLLGRCLVPSRARVERRVVLLVRDPRDAFVSSYFEFTKRRDWFSGSMEEMLTDPIFGLGRIVDVMNGWAAEWRGSQRAKVLRYEDLARDPESGFRGFAEFAFAHVHDEAVRSAVEFASFPHMRELEASGYFRDIAFRGATAGDSDSRKVRRGKVGGFSDYLHGQCLDLAAREVDRLDPWFGYDFSVR